MKSSRACGTGFLHESRRGELLMNAAPLALNRYLTPANKHGSVVPEVTLDFLVMEDPAPKAFGAGLLSAKEDAKSLRVGRIPIPIFCRLRMTWAVRSKKSSQTCTIFHDSSAENTDEECKSSPVLHAFSFHPCYPRHPRLKQDATNFLRIWKSSPR